MGMRGMLKWFVVIAVVGCSGSSASGPTPGGSVTVNDDYFDPESVLPDGNGLVTWNWAGMNPHDVIFADGMGSTVGTQTTGTHERDFTGAAPGTYTYACTIHGGMTGEVVVP